MIKHETALQKDLLKIEDNAENMIIGTQNHDMMKITPRQDKKEKSDNVKSIKPKNRRQ